MNELGHRNRWLRSTRFASCSRSKEVQAQSEMLFWFVMQRSIPQMTSMSCQVETMMTTHTPAPEARALSTDVRTGLLYKDPPSDKTGKSHKSCHKAARAVFSQCSYARGHNSIRNPGPRLITSSSQDSTCTSDLLKLSQPLVCNQHASSRWCLARRI